MYMYVIDYVEKIILEFVVEQVVCELFKLKHVYILPISPIFNLRPSISP